MPEHYNKPPETPLSRQADPGEHEHIAKEVDKVFAALSGDLSSSQVVGVATMFLGVVFNGCVLPQYRLAAFDEAMAAVRKGLEDQMK